MGTLSLIDSFFDQSGNSQHVLARIWGRMLLAASLIRVRAEGVGTPRPQRHLRLRLQSPEPDGHPRDPHYPAAPVPLLRQEGPLPDPVRRHAPAPRRTPAGGPLQRARLAQKHDRGGATSSARRGVSVLLFPEGGRNRPRDCANSRKAPHTSPSKPGFRWSRWPSSACGKNCPWAPSTCAAAKWRCASANPSRRPACSSPPGSTSPNRLYREISQLLEAPVA